MRTNTTHPRQVSSEFGHSKTPLAWVPTTQYSILAQFPNGTIMKLLIAAARRANFWLKNGTHVPDATGVCVKSSDSGACAGLRPGWSPEGACCVCSVAQPCLFDVTQDEEEVDNVAAQHPALVQQMVTQLSTYKLCVDGKMTRTGMERYDCGLKWQEGNATYHGPCCKPKNASKAPPPPR
jgi:hypothetical protein